MQNCKQDKKLCKQMAESIANIVRYSFNENFRDNCFQALAIESTQDLEKEVYLKFNSVIKTGGCNLGTRKEIGTNAVVREVTSKPLPATIQRQAAIAFTPSPKKSWLKVAAEQNQKSLQKRSPEQQQNRKIPERQHYSFPLWGYNWKVKRVIEGNTQVPKSYSTSGREELYQEKTPRSPQLIKKPYQDVDIVKKVLFLDD